MVRKKPFIIIYTEYKLTCTRTDAQKEKNRESEKENNFRNDIRLQCALLAAIYRLKSYTENMCFV